MSPARPPSRSKEHPGLQRLLIPLLLQREP